MTTIRLSWASTFLIAEIEPSDKERARWGPAITVDRGSKDPSGSLTTVRSWGREY
jgi:hypothetical protein